jgi:hypothetical protein
MKEHSLFIAVAFQPKNEEMILEAKSFNQHFNTLLNQAVKLASTTTGVKNDAVTKYTLDAEKATSFVTDFPIDTNLTSYELTLHPMNQYIGAKIEDEVYTLNNLAIQATKRLINFKSRIINSVLSCQIYTGNYPLLLDHIRREAIFFVELLTNLQKRVEISVMEDAIRQQIFWNQIMAEHAKFIRGLLDPTEEELIAVANNFGNQFDELNKQALMMSQTPSTIPQVTMEGIELTKGIQEFKTQGTEGLINCKIKSLILPLLGDHTIREANHYLNLLESISSMKK